MTIWVDAQLSAAIAGPRLADLMIEHNVGVVESQRYVIKKLNTEYFEG